MVSGDLDLDIRTGKFVNETHFILSTWSIIFLVDNSKNIDWQQTFFGFPNSGLQTASINTLVYFMASNISEMIIGAVS